MRVLIVGAGLGGLCLAHGLRRAGVDVAVWERHATPADQPSSYGIHLNADGLQALHACLPGAHWRRLRDSAAPALDVVRFHDEHLRVLAVRDNRNPADADPVTRRAVFREALRDVLLDGLDTDVVRWGTTFTRYEQAEDRTVRLHGENGSAVTADLLVGADGSNSRVRA
jgi:2-polyprenyl-6-methoxyphenol hydroxylase-like FAD-dependent oxidoreductase